LLQAVAKVEEPNIPLIPENFIRPFSLQTPPIEERIFLIGRIKVDSTYIV